MYDIKFEAKFKKDCKRARSRNLDMKLLNKIIDMLANGQKLPEKYRDHKLNNDKQFKNCRECHVNPDWLLVYRIHQKELILECVRFGTHSELFGSDELYDNSDSVNELILL